MKLTTLHRITLALAFAAIATFAAGAGRQVTITGEVVDTACWLGHGAKGADHIKCAATCARNGIPLAILDSAANQLYLPIATDHQNPNNRLMDYIESKVKVTGRLIEKSGVKGIVIEKIERSG